MRFRAVFVGWYGTRHPPRVSAVVMALSVVAALEQLLALGLMLALELLLALLLELELALELESARYDIRRETRTHREAGSVANAHEPAPPLGRPPPGTQSNLATAGSGSKLPSSSM